MKKVLSLLIVFMLVVVLAGCGKKNKNKEKEPEFMDEYKYNDLVFKNDSVSTDGVFTTITSTLTNTSDSDKEIGIVKLTVTYTDASDFENTAELLIYFGNKIDGNQVLKTETTVDFDITNIIKVEYEFVQK